MRGSDNATRRKSQRRRVESLVADCADGEGRSVLDGSRRRLDFRSLGFIARYERRSTHKIQSAPHFRLRRTLVGQMLLEEILDSVLDVGEGGAADAVVGA